MLSLLVTSGCEERRHTHTILTEHYERVKSIDGTLEASALTRNASGVFDVLIFDSEGHTYSSEGAFRNGIQKSPTLDIYWNTDNELVLKRDGAALGMWRWNQTKREIIWTEVQNRNEK